MELSLRKEQGLLVGVVLLGAFMAHGYWNDAYSRRRQSRPEKAYEARIPYTPFVADPKDDPGLGNDIFLEPSETRPLPPADLPFPSLDTLPPVAVPLPIGQQAGACADLRVRLPVVKAVPAAEGSGPAPAEPAHGDPGNGSGSGTGADTGADTGAGTGSGTGAGAVQDPLSAEQLARRYDRLILLEGNKPWGFFVGPDDVKYQLGDSAGPYSDKIAIRFRWIDEKSGKQVNVEDYPGDKVQQLQLAKTAKNEVEIRDRRVPWTPVGLSQQVDYLLWLIQEGRREPWVFTRAMLRANTHIECTKHDVDAYRLKVRILRAQGDLEGEWRLYQELPPALSESAFRYQGMGEVQAMLGLRKQAEANLRKAVELGPVDPRTHGALAGFLLAQGRPREAMVEADHARRDRRRLEHPDERLRLDQTVVGAHLATGDTAGAKAAVPIDLPELIDQVRYLGACVAYAQGDLGTARSEFEACAASGEVPDAALGVAACQLRQGEVVQARDAFGAVADQNPRLRHLALAGRGLALEHIEGRQAAALEALVAAHEADPQDPYVLYLLGRQRRLSGDLDGAILVLKQALAFRDDFKEALAELALTYERLYQRDTDASALSHAVRYTDRLVAMEARTLTASQKPTPLYRDMQGRFHFEAGDYRGARGAFETGQEQSEFSKIGLAIVTYKQKRYEDARDILTDLSRHLPLGHAMRAFADDLGKRMDAHDNLEQIQVTFDGSRLPKSWKTAQAGPVSPKVAGGELRVEARDLAPRGTVMAYRELPGTGRFVSLDLSFRNSGQNPRFVGVEINNVRRGRGTSVPDFMARFGLDEDGMPFLQIEDGRNLKPEETEPRVFRTAVVHKDRMNHLRLEAVPQAGNQDDKTLFLRAYWNGEMVHERRLQRLRRGGGGGGGTLNLELKVEGGKGRTDVNVAFDDFRLVQIRGQ